MDNCQLTKSQLDLYDYISTYYNEERTWPTYKEIQGHFNWKWPNQVNRRLKALVKKGYLKKKDGQGYLFTDKVPGVSSDASVEKKEAEGKV